MHTHEPVLRTAAFHSSAALPLVAVLAVCACNSAENGTAIVPLANAGRPGGDVVAPPPASAGSVAPAGAGAGRGALGAAGAGQRPAAVSGGASGASGAAGLAAGNGGVAGLAAGSGGAVGGAPAAAGSGTAGASAGAGAGGAAGQAGGPAAAEDACGPILTGPKQAAKPKAVVMHALVEYHTKDENEWLNLSGTMIVPAKPPASGVIFVWPGTQTMPGTSKVQPVGEGVLQPVLTWGSSCVPGALPGHDTWWISPVYVNEGTNIRELAGCHGGSVIRTDVGDRLDFVMHLNKTTWEQTVVDTNSKQMTKFDIDLRGQPQQRALFEIELKTSAKPVADSIFENVVLTMRDPDPGACALNNAGMNDYVSQSRVSADGTRCCIERIVLRADGVPASSKDP
jgi:hypothetical protein